jgi:hypothetical protein
MRTLTCLLLLLAAPFAQAQMYKCTDGGKTRFSDKPFTDCKSNQVTGAPSAPVVAPSPSATAPKQAAGAPKPASKSKHVAKVNPVTRQQQDFDNRCAQIRRDYSATQRAPDTAQRDQRLESMRAGYSACR